MGVKTVISDLAAGRLQLADAVRDFRGRDWSHPTLSSDALQRGDDTEPPANDWADVEQARRDGRISPAEYVALRAAVAKRT